MFRASSRSSSGAQQLQWQPLVLPLERGGSSAVGRGWAGRPAGQPARPRPTAPDGHLLTVTIPDAILIQFDLLRMNKILLETCTCKGS